MGLCPSKLQPHEEVPCKPSDQAVQVVRAAPENAGQVHQQPAENSDSPPRSASSEPAAADGPGVALLSPTAASSQNATNPPQHKPNDANSMSYASYVNPMPSVAQTSSPQSAAAAPQQAQPKPVLPPAAATHVVAPSAPAPATAGVVRQPSSADNCSTSAPPDASSSAASATAAMQQAEADAPSAQHAPPQQMQQQEQQQPQQPQSPTSERPRPAAVAMPSALAQRDRSTSQPGRSVKFAEPPPDSEDGSAHGGKMNQRASDGGASSSSSSGGKPPARRSLPRRVQSSSNMRSPGPSPEVSEAVLAKQAEILRSNKAGKLRLRRGGLDSSFAALQDALTQDEAPLDHVATRAAGLKHIGYGPFKRENQDEFFIQVGDFGGVPGGNLFCVFDGHGTYGKDAALYSRQLLPRLLDVELRKYFLRVTQDSEPALRGAVEVLITEVFGETERNLAKSGVNLASSGTTCTVAFQRGNRLWVASAGDSRAILCTRNALDQWRALPLTIDHRPRRPSERERIEAAGARVAPKRLPSGRSVGEPRLWLQDAGGPGLLLSRSLGDLTAATVGCTSDPEVTFTTLRPQIDQVLVMATDGVWDVLTNEQVCDIVVESPDPHIACRRVLDAALYEWEERMSADNITVLVVEFEWGEDGSTPSIMDHCTASASFRPDQDDAMLGQFRPGPFQP